MSIIKCTPGNKKCGQRCIPHEQKCHEHEGLKSNIKLEEKIDLEKKKSRKLINPFTEIASIKKTQKVLVPDFHREDMQSDEQQVYTVGEIKPGQIIRNYFTTDVEKSEKSGKAMGTHYGVYLGDGKIAHIKTGRKLPDGRDFVAPQSFVVESFEKAYKPNQSKWEAVDSAAPARSVEEIRQMAMNLEGAPIKYSTLYNNCEHVARAIVEGKATSTQQDAVGKFLSPIINTIVDAAVRKKIGRNEMGINARELEFAEGETPPIVAAVMEAIQGIEKQNLSKDQQVALITQILKGHIALDAIINLNPEMLNAPSS
jgi:hypothetical protein